MLGDPFKYLSLQSVNQCNQWLESEVFNSKFEVLAGKECPTLIIEAGDGDKRTNAEALENHRPDLSARIAEATGFAEAVPMESVSSA